jgi:hypothetical protein
VAHDEALPQHPGCEAGVETNAERGQNTHHEEAGTKRSVGGRYLRGTDLSLAARSD